MAGRSAAFSLLSQWLQAANQSAQGGAGPGGIDLDSATGEAGAGMGAPAQGAALESGAGTGAAQGGIAGSLASGLPGIGALIGGAPISACSGGPVYEEEDEPVLVEEPGEAGESLFGSMGGAVGRFLGSLF
jgi:hypothetical protein